MSNAAFAPQRKSTIQVAATTTSGTDDKPLLGTPQGGEQLWVHNAGPNICRLSWGADNCDDVSTADIQLPLGVSVITVGAANLVKAQCDTGTAALDITRGTGVR